MPEFNKNGEPIVAVVRIIEYSGTMDWVNRTIQASRVPIQGEFKGMDGKGLPDGCSIKSGLVVWMIEAPPEEPKPPVIPIPPGTGRVM